MRLASELPVKVSASVPPVRFSRLSPVLSDSMRFAFTTCDTVDDRFTDTDWVVVSAKSTESTSTPDASTIVSLPSARSASNR